MVDIEELRSKLQVLINHSPDADILKFAEAAAHLDVRSEDPQAYLDAVNEIREIVSPQSVMVPVRILQTSGEVAAEMVVSDNLTIAGLLKEFCCERGRGELPPGRLRLLLNGEVLGSDAVLRALDLPEDRSLHLVRIASDSIEISHGSHSYDKLFKLLLLGDSGVGKSAFVERYSEDTFTPSYVSTIGVDFKIRSVQVNGDSYVKLQIWDTAGQERFRTVTSAYFRGSHGFLILFSLTSSSSFQNLPYWLEEIEKYASRDASGEPLPRILIGTHSDLAEDRTVSDEEARTWASNHNMTYFEVSSRQDIGVKDAMHALVGLCLHTER
jgi:Ras-related protein Rab-1A